MPSKPVVHPESTSLASQATVTRTYKNGITERSETSDDTLTVHKFITEPASVRVGMGMTISLGNYESVRIDVNLSVPCYKEEVNDAYAYASEWVQAKTLAEAQAAKDFGSKRKTR
jgi:hypothetical protein